MRLSQRQAETIRQTAQEVFGDNAQVWLFGSRTDDSAKGGDIDLYVESLIPIESTVAKISRMHALLQTRLGEQKIDLLSWSPGQMRLPIHDQARLTGIKL